MTEPIMTRWRRLRRHADLALLLVALLLVVGLTLLLRPTPQTTPLVFYASPTGSGTACTETAPCRVADWWPLAQPGATLLLLDGTYRRSQGGAIDPPESLAGAAGAPITVRALHDGGVTIDAESGFAVYLAPSNAYWHIAGINAHTGGEALYRVRGDHTRLSRVIGWNGTSGQADSTIFSFDAEDTVCEDCAAWGTNVRKVFTATQSSAQGQMQQFTGFRRAWGEWNDHPSGLSCPNNTFQVAYRSRQQRFENVIGTVRVTGDVCDFEAVIDASYDCNATDMQTGSQVLGSLFYVPNSTPFPSPGSGTVVFAACISTLTYRDVAAVLGSEHTTQRPFDFRNATSVTQETGNVCERCLGIHAGTPSVNQDGSGWAMPGFREGRTVAEAMDGQSVYDALPGLCREYQDGILSDTPLWPWKMNQRILDARRASGAPAVDVTATVEALLGKIPPECRSDHKPPIPPVPPGSPTLACSGELGSKGMLTMTCVPGAR